MTESARLTYSIPDNPESIKPYDGRTAFTPKDLTDLIGSEKIPNILFGVEALDRNKAISKLAFHVIALQSSIDVQFSILLAGLTKANAEIVAAMLNAIISAQMRRSVISDAVEVAKLSDNEKTVFLSLFSLSERTSTVRNHFAHHLWGLVPGFEDYLLLLPPAHYTAANATVQQMPIASNGVERAKYLLSKSKMYNKSHLDGLLEEQNFIYGKLKELEVLFQSPSALRQIAFAALIYEPRILSVWKSHKKKPVQKNIRGAQK